MVHATKSCTKTPTDTSCQSAGMCVIFLPDIWNRNLFENKFWKFWWKKSEKTVELCMLPFFVFVETRTSEINYVNLKMWVFSLMGSFCQNQIFCKRLTEKFSRRHNRKDEGEFYIYFIFQDTFQYFRKISCASMTPGEPSITWH